MDLSIDGIRQEDRQYLLDRKGELIHEIITSEDILSVKTETLDRIKFVYEDAGLRPLWLEISRVAFTKKMLAIARRKDLNKYTRESALKELIRLGRTFPGLLELLKISDADIQLLSREVESLNS